MKRVIALQSTGCCHNLSLFTFPLRRLGEARTCGFFPFSSVPLPLGCWKCHSDVVAFGNMMERLEPFTIVLDIVEGQHQHPLTVYASTPPPSSNVLILCPHWRDGRIVWLAGSSRSLTFAGWKHEVKKSHGHCHPVWFQGVDSLWSIYHRFIRLEGRGINAIKNVWGQEIYLEKARSVNVV